MMPKMDGITVLRKVREAGSQMPILMLTAKSEVEDKVLGLDTGVNDYLAKPFHTLAQSQKKELDCRVQPLLTLCGNDKAISRLASILLDNAIKYSPEDSTVSLVLEKQGRHLSLTVSNLCATPVNAADLRHVFDRFYRMDVSRNSETGGHGIGLSMAQAIVNDHGGKIGATSPYGNSFVVTVSFPG